MTRLRRVGSVVVAFLLVTTAVLSPLAGPASPVGTASAVDFSAENCTWEDVALGGLVSVINPEDSCGLYNPDPDAENLTATDAYANALALKDSTDSYVNTTDNFMENSRTVAYSKAKITVVQELNNGSSASATSAAVNQTVRDYYSRLEAQMIEDWNAKAQQVMYLDETGLEVSIEVKQTAVSDMGAPTGTSTVDYELANGSTKQITTINFSASNSWNAISPISSGEFSYPGYVEVKDPGGSAWTPILYTTQYGLLDHSGYIANYEHPPPSSWMNQTLLNRPDAQSVQVTRNMKPYVDELAQQYQAGQINSSELALIDPSTIALEASTSLNSTGYYGYSAIMLASIGATGNINVSHRVNVNGTVMNGTLYYTADDAPANGWETGETYNMSTFNGTFYFAISDPEASSYFVDLETYGENVTIEEATNTKTGENVNTTTLHRYTYDSANASALEAEIDRLKELREEYEETTAGGGAPGSGIGGAGVGVIVTLAAVVLAFIATRD